MLSKSAIDEWYENKSPKYNLSSSGIIANEIDNAFFDRIWKNHNIYDYVNDYGDTKGSRDLISILCNKYNCKPDNILITNGASEAIYILLNMFKNHNKEILYQLPYFHNLDDIIRSLGNIPKHFELDDSHNFTFLKNNFVEKITEKTICAIFNFPNNPTGSVLQNDEYADIIKIIKSYNSLAIFDEVSIDIDFKNTEGYIAKHIFNELNNVICINSMSKSFGFAGLRIGWIIAHKDIIDICKTTKEYISVSCSPLSQLLASEILLNKDNILKKNTDLVKNNLAYLLEISDSNKDYISVCVPKGGACCFVKVLKNIDVYEFCIELYKAESILVTPGSVFGYKKYFRLGLGINEIIFKTAVKRIVDYIKTL